MDLKTELHQRLGNMERDQEFINLTYDEQQVQRSKLTDFVLQKDPQYAGLDQRNKIAALDGIVNSRAPIFKDPRVAEIAQTMHASAEAGELTVDEWSATGAASGLLSNALLGHVIARPAAKLADALLGWTKSDRWNWTDLIDSSVGSDHDKLKSYVDHALIKNMTEDSWRKNAPPEPGVDVTTNVNKVKRTDPGLVKSSYASAKLGGSIAGFAGDFLMFHGTFAKASVVPMKALGATLAANVKGGFGTWVGKVALPSFVSGTSSGLFGIFKEQAMAHLTDDDSRLMDSAGKIAKTFGSYAALDYALNLSAGTLRHAMLLKRLAKGSGARKMIYTPEEIHRLSEMAVHGEIPEELAQQYDPATLRYIKGMADAKKLHNVPLDDLRLKPYDHLLYEATAAEMVVHRDPLNGSFMLFSNDAKGRLIVENLEDILSAKRKVSAGLWHKASKLEEGREEFLRIHSNMMQYSLGEKIIDGSMDPFKVKGVADEDVRKVLSRKVARNFTSPIDRPYIGINEADSFEKLYNQKGGFAKVMTTEVPEEALSDVGKGRNIFRTNLPVNIDDGAVGEKVFVMLRNPAPKDAYIKATAYAKKAIGKGSALTEDTLRSMYLMEAGFDGVVLNRAKVQAFYPDKLKLIANQFDPYTGKIGKITDPSTIPDTISVQGAAARSYKAVVGGRAFTRNEALVRQTAATFHGNLKGQDIENFSRLVLADAGVDASKVHIKVGKAIDTIDTMRDTKAFTRFKGGNATIEVPGTISTPSAQKKFITELFEELQNVSQTLGKADLPIRKPYITGKFLAQFDSPFKDVSQTEKWLRDSVTNNLHGTFDKTAKGFAIKLPGKAPIEAKTITELTDRLLVENLDVGYLRFDLAKKGYTVTQTGTVKDGISFTVRGKDLSEPVTGRSVNEVLDKLNYRPSKISNKFAPKIAAIDNGKVFVEFQDGMAIGPKKELKKVFAQFEDMDYMAQSRKLASFENGDVLIAPNGGYEVHMPEFGIIEKFSDPKSARAFASGKWKEAATLERVANRKGLELFYDKGVRKIADGKSTFLVPDDDSLAKVLAEYPDTTGGPDLLGDLDPDTLSAMDKVLHNFDLSQIPAQESSPLKILSDISTPAEGAMEMGFTGEARALLSNMDAWAQTELPKLGLQDTLRDYRRLENAVKIAQVEIRNTDKAIAAIFQTSDGNLLSLARRKAVYYHAGAQTVEEKATAFATYKALSSEEQTIVSRIKNLMGELTPDGRVTGLAGKFGVNPEDMITNYMPRIKQYALANVDRVNGMVTAEELLDGFYKNEYGKATPSKIKAFFKNMRTSEVLAFAAVDDPIQALQHYNRIGHRQLRMGQAWEQLSASLKASNVPIGVTKRFQRYRELLMGLSSSDGADTAGRMGAALARKMGLDPENGKNLMNAYFTVNYLSNMAYRPWLAVRNSTQVWTTLAPRFGNHWVDDAIKKVNEMGDEGYKYLESIGVILEAPPIVNDIMDASTLLGKITRKGLNMFKRSDDITRAVAYHTGAVRFDFALDKLKRGVLKNTDDFLKEAGITKMDDNTISEVRRLMTNGSQESINGARALFGQRIVSETMFEYRSAQSPTLYTGSFWGKLFGQYGTYAAGYRANLARGLSQGSFGDKAAFTARFLGNQAALYGAFTAVGINAKNFIPGAPALFGGGPQFEVGIALAQAMAPDYRGAQARSQLMRWFSPVYHTKSGGTRLNFPERAPGSLQLRYIQKSLEYLEEGDYWRAFLAATTTPVLDPE